jgi:exodeoxyribonuclease VII large subunit
MNLNQEIFANEDQREEPRVYTVAELTGDIKAILEAAFDSIWVEGEISNMRVAASRHSYFVLKDDKAQIRCVLFKNYRAGLKYNPEEGDQVLLLGRATVYDARGEYQLIVETMEPRGLGALHKAYEQLKEKLAKQGLFDEDKKKPVPEFPWKVGVITSPTGAAVRDILNIIRRRNPKVSVLLNPVRVQGEGSAAEIAEAIRRMNQFNDIDVLIVGRGGGSIEDLWAFNEEEVARAIYDSRIPIVSAVGHEIDFTIADFVADLRAPTPSAAAELTVPVLADSLQELRSLSQELVVAMHEKIESHSELLRRLIDRRFFREPQLILEPAQQRLDDMNQRLLRGLSQWVVVQRQKLEGGVRQLFHLSPKRNIQIFAEKNQNLRHRLSQLIKSRIRFDGERFDGMIKNLNALSPLSILDRGYSICTKDDKAVKSSAEIKPDDQVKVRLAKGHLDCRVEKAIPSPGTQWKQIITACLSYNNAKPFNFQKTCLNSA